MIPQLVTDCAKKHPGGPGLPPREEGPGRGSTEHSKRAPAGSQRLQKRGFCLPWFKNP